MLPLVVFEADDGDRLVVIVDGDKLAAAPVRRSEIGRVLTELVTKFAVPTRVELHELDGSVLADIVQPPPPPEPEPEPEQPIEEPAARRAPESAEVDVDGFLPGEDIAVAVVARHGSAGPDGHVQVRLDRSELPDGPDPVEIIMVGRVSGTTACRLLT
ncbi:MAG TPA: hypothetical protein GXZ45_13950 [Propionibacterium sp.]|nr:hypothetical protein [Propionibacterium sp.]